MTQFKKPLAIRIDQKYIPLPINKILAIIRDSSNCYEEVAVDQYEETLFNSIINDQEGFSLGESERNHMNGSQRIITVFTPFNVDKQGI